MAARKQSKSKSKKSARSSGGARRSADALALLRADHQKVDGLFKQFDKARGDSRKDALAEQICRELMMHAQVEEEIFYPAARQALRGEQDLLDEATVEHASAKDLIAQIEGARAGDELFDARVTVLGEYIRHHVKEEQNELFPKVKKTRLDLKELGARIEARKLELEKTGIPQGGASRTAGARGSAGGLSGRAASKGSKGKEDEGLFASVARGIGLSR